MPVAPENNSAQRRQWFCAALLTVVIVWLHFQFWHAAGGLWRDEVNTANLANSGSLEAMTHDSFPILLPLLLKAWSHFGNSDAWLRLLGTGCGLLIVAGFWLVAAASRRPPLWSLVLLGLSSHLIIYGDSLRAHGLGCALVVLALAALWWLLQAPSWLRTAAFALAATLSVQTLYQNAVLIFAISLGGFAVCARRKSAATALKILLAGSVAAVSLLPYYANLRALPEASVELRRGFSPFITSLNFEVATGFPFEHYTIVWEILATLVIGFGVCSLRQKVRAENPASAELSWFASVTLLAVVGGFLGFLWLAALSARSWYFLPPLALVAVCFDLGLAWTTWPRLVRVAVIGLLAGTVLVAVPTTNSALQNPFSNADQVAARLRTIAAPEDFIIVSPWFCGISFNRYFSGPAAWNTLPPLADHSGHRYDLVLENMKNTNALAPIFKKITTTLRSGHRVWVVGFLPGEVAAGPMPAPLPPPPYGGYGFSDIPYMTSWAQQAEYFLNHRAVRFGALPAAGERAALQETLRIFLAEGWRD